MTDKYTKVRWRNVIYYITETNAALVSECNETQLMFHSTYAVDLNTNSLIKCRGFVTDIFDKALLN